MLLVKKRAVWLELSQNFKKKKNSREPQSLANLARQKENPDSRTGETGPETKRPPLGLGEADSL